jgi:hypothetical protein
VKSALLWFEISVNWAETDRENAMPGRAFIDRRPDRKMEDRKIGDRKMEDRKMGDRKIAILIFLSPIFLSGQVI